MTDEELLQTAPSIGTLILVRFPKPIPPQETDPHWYPALVVRPYVRDGRPLLSAAVFVDHLARVPQPPGGSYAGLAGPVQTCMDIEPYRDHEPDKGGYKLRVV